MELLVRADRAYKRSETLGHVHKAFIRKTDKDGETYYVPNFASRRQREANVGGSGRLFEMSELLLDLDADGSKQVRPYDAQDESKMSEAWPARKDPRSARVDHWVGAIRKHHNESQKKMELMHQEPASIWRLSPHDLLSRALHAVPHLPAEGAEKPVDRSNSAFANKLSAENAIPEFTQENDQLVMEWMVLRHNQFKDSPQVASLNEFQQALSAQTSIVGVRRLFTRSMAATLDALRPSEGSEETEMTTLLSVVSQMTADACQRIIAASTGPEEGTQALLFSGNILERYSNAGGECLLPLWRLRLLLSVQLRELEVTAACIRQAFQAGIWNMGSVAPEQILGALESYTLALEGGDESVLHSRPDRQRLFNLIITKEDENGGVPASFCGAISYLLTEDRSLTPEQALGMFENYMMALGHLGAVRTLWSEFQNMAPILRDRDQGASSHLVTEKALMDVFRSSLQASLRVAGPLEDLSWTGLSLTESIRFDTQTINALDLKDLPPRPAVGEEATDPLAEKLLEAASAIMQQRTATGSASSAEQQAS